MPPLDSDLIMAPRKANISFALEPVQNMLYSLLLLNRVEELSGLGEWVTRMATTLPPERLHLNRVVVEGLHFAILPEQSWPSFPAYLDDLAAQAPTTLRDRLLRKLCRPQSMAANAVPSSAEILASVEVYLSYLRGSGVAFDEAIEREAHALLNQPPRMHKLILSHMRSIWQDALAPEWGRISPMLKESVDAFKQLDLSGLTAIEAARQVTGQELPGKWEQLLAEAQRIVFVPSAHLGPYPGKLKDEKTIWILFGARLPEGARSGSSDLSRSDLLVRLGALTDDTRLQILALLSQHDELCAQDIMTRLDVSQSAASRHLRQLSATGYLTERRRAGEKCYSLNRDRVSDTFRALDQFLAQF